MGSMVNLTEIHDKIITMFGGSLSHIFQQEGCQMDEIRKKLLQRMSTADYAAIWLMAKTEDAPEEGKKLYLSEIAEKLSLPLAKVSKIVKELQERGLVIWEHDGNGEDGTYILMTERGVQAAEERKQTMERVYRNVIQRFGEMRFAALLKELSELEEIMNEEIEKR